MTSSLLRPFGFDVFCTGKKFLVYNMVGRNLKVKYRRSILGVLWTLLAPASLVAIYYFVFKIVMKIQTPHYLAYLVAGILPWTFFSQTISEGLESISGNAALISKIPVPLQAFPLVGVVTNLVTLIFALPIILAVAIASGIPLGFSLLLLLVLFGCVAITAYAVSIVLGLIYIFLNDLKHIIGIILQLWFYATPVLYRVDMIPEKLRWFLYVNPVGPAFVSIHTILSEGKWPLAIDVMATVAWSFASLFIAIVVFKSINQDVAENL
jgi:ABC-type polysaccharide/polyol phosphate export permease